MTIRLRSAWFWPVSPVEPALAREPSLRLKRPWGEHGKALRCAAAFLRPARKLALKIMISDPYAYEADQAIDAVQLMLLTWRSDG